MIDRRPSPAPQTLAQKLVARAAGLDHGTPGQIVTCQVDLAMMHDSGGPRRVQPLLERLGATDLAPDEIAPAIDRVEAALAACLS